MSQIKPAKLPNGKIILMEIDDSAQLPNLSMLRDDDDLGAKGGNDAVSSKIQDLAGTVQAITGSISSSFKQLADANVEKITLKFGIKLGGEAGIPFVTKGSAESNIAIEVECKILKDI